MMKEYHYYDDLIGKKIGRLTVLENTYKRNKDNRVLYKCQCECGNIVEVAGKYLKSGNTKSCGCLQRESVIKKNYKHGLANTRICSIWRDIRRRCNDKTRERYYKHYGARGIKVCKEWDNPDDGFMNFYNWSMVNGYKEDLTIERIDVNGDYCPENCKWIPLKEQAWNKTTTIKTIDGYPVAKWAFEHGLDVRKIRNQNKDIEQITLYELHRRHFDYPLAPCTPDML